MEGESREALCRAAEDAGAGAGLLVVGSRGLGAVGRYVRTCARLMIDRDTHVIITD